MNYQIIVYLILGAAIGFALAWLCFAAAIVTLTGAGVIKRHTPQPPQSFTTSIKRPQAGK